MYKKIILSFIFILNAVLIALGFTSCKEAENVYSPYEVVIDIVDRSEYSADGLVLGRFYYEKPRIPEHFEAAKKINDFFDLDCDTFFNGSSNGASEFYGEDSFQRMQEYLVGGIERLGEEGLARQPYIYFVKVEVTFLSEDYVSFRQTKAWAASGPRDIWNRGLTFSLKTGELVPFTDFIDIEANDFKTKLCDILIPLFDSYWTTKEDILNTYGPNEDNSYKVKYYSVESELDKNYFYDGNSINIILNYAMFPHDGLIFEWNGKTDDTFGGEVYCYHTNEDDELERYEYNR